MAIVSVNFSKVSAERKKPATGKVGVNNNVSLRDLEKTSMKVTSDNVALKMTFVFSSDYDPDVAKIRIEGEIIMVETAKNAEEFMKQWDKDKTLPQNEMISVYNAVMHKCFINAIALSRDLNLPAPIRFPRVTEKIAEDLKNPKE